MARPQAVFYYDLGSPHCYLAAERLPGTLPTTPEWEPVLAADLDVVQHEVDRGPVERLAALYGLQPVRWPAGWPPDTRLAMLAATYAKQVGRGVAFSLAAFRQAFAAGRELSDPDTVLIAGAACEMHPTALLKAIGLRSVGRGLASATARAREHGVKALPALALGEALLSGPRILEQALEVLR